MPNAFAIAYATANAIAGLVGLAAAALVASAGFKRGVNRALAAFLAVQGLNALAFVFSFLDDHFLNVNGRLYAVATAIALVPLYALFLGQALATPLVRPLRPRLVRAALVAIAVGASLAWLLAPAWFVSADPGSPLGLAPTPAGEALLDVMLAGGAIVALYSVIASVDALRRTQPRSLARRRARGYLAAFLCNDASLAAGVIAYLLGMGGNVAAADVLTNVVSPILGVTFVALLTRTLLRDQLFDFDLRVKIGLRRSAVATVFLVVFFAVEQAIQSVATNAWGIIAGVAAAALLLLARKPIERAADRLAGAVLPHADEDASRQKRNVYRAQVEWALANDGIIDARGREMLETLRASLGLARDEADHIEREALAPAAARDPQAVSEARKA